MGRLFNESFFHFLFGFVAMLIVSFSITIAINFYGGKNIEQTAVVSDAPQKSPQQ
jgi:hypothetical protein